MLSFEALRVSPAEIWLTVYRRRVVVKFGRKIFFTRGLYNNRGACVRSSRDLPDSFYEISFIIFKLLVFFIFGIFSAKLLKKLLAYSAVYFWHIQSKNYFHRNIAECPWDTRGVFPGSL